MIYIVSYELVPKFLRNIDSFLRELQQSSSWAHYITNTWLISTPETIEQLNTRLRKYLIDQDLLLIMKVEGEYAGWMPEEAWDWIQERINLGELYK